MIRQSQRYQAQVQAGDQTGRQLSYPTINLNPLLLPQTMKRGVYASWVWVAGRRYQGALYFGPRLVKDEEHDVLEIFLLDFSGELYGEEIEFTVEQYLREPRDFTKLEELGQQIDQDIKGVKEALNEDS